MARRRRDSSEAIKIGRKERRRLRALHRLAERLHRAFPRLPIMVLLDGLYPVGPVMELCRRRGWEYMIVLQDGSLAHVWEEYEGLKKLLEPEDRHRMRWADREQKVHWINDIDFSYHSGRRTRSPKLNLVICEERWQQVDADTGQLVTKTARHAWLSSRRLSQGKARPIPFTGA